MITFEFVEETHNSDSTLKDRTIYWILTTHITKEDEMNTDEIYEQLDAEQVFNV